MGTFRPLQTRPARSDMVKGGIGAFLGILLAALAGTVAPEGAPALPWIVAPIGASSVLVFAVPASPLAQPWSVVGGNVLSALVATTVVVTVGQGPAAVALAVGLAIVVMMVGRCVHPPGGAVALLVAYGSESLDAHGFGVALWPVGLGSVSLVAVGVAYNAAIGRRYPHVPPVTTAPAGPTGQVPPTERAGVQVADVTEAMAKLGQGLDVTPADVVALVRDAEARALDRRLGRLTVGDVMATDVRSVSPVESVYRVRLLMTEHGIKALPVVTPENHLVGILSIADLFNQDPGSLATVATLMTSPVTTLPADAPVADLVALMADRDLRHVPVVAEGDVLVGMVTRAELVAVLHRALLGGAGGDPDVDPLTPVG